MSGNAAMKASRVKFSEARCVVSEALAKGERAEGAVIDEIDALSRMDMALIVASCAPRSFDCHCGSPCCRGWRPNARWSDAVDFLSRFVLEKQGDTYRNLNLRRRLVEKYFGRKCTNKELAALADVHPATIASHFKAVSQVLKKAEHEPWERLSARLATIGALPVTIRIDAGTAARRIERPHM